LAVAAPSRSSGRGPRRLKAPIPWWGDDGPAPHLRYPGVTIEIPAIWAPITSLRKVTRGGHIVGWTKDGVAIEEWWASDGGRWEQPDGRFWFHRETADRACDFFPEFLRHHIGEFAGKPFHLLDYQRVLLTRPIFGWLRREDGYRRFRKLFAFIVKASGKSPWAAGTGLWLTICDNEPSSQVFALANDRDQARVVHENAKVMVESSPELTEMCDILRDAIYHPASRSTYQVRSSDATGSHGQRPHGLIFDEFHGQKNRDQYEAFKKSMAKRRQPLLIIITHAGDDDESICFEEYEGAKRVLSGNAVNEETFLPVIFEATPDDDFTDPAVWRRVNPGHGVTIQHQGIAIECEEAKNEPRKLNDFLRYHLNRWVNQSVAWIPIQWWDACDDPMPADAALVDLVCAGGLDMSQKIDLTAFVVAFRHPIASTAPAVEIVEGSGQKVQRSLNFRVTLVPFFWIPENTMREREKEDGVPYSLWARQGLITPTEGDMIDYDRVFRDITEKIAVRFPRLKTSEIGYDEAFAADVAQRLMAAGYKMVPTPQNYGLSSASYLWEGLIKAKRVTHGGHRILRNHVENVAVKRDDAERIKPVKPRNSRKRIDGVVAGIMSVDRLVNQPEQPEKKRSRYVTGGGFIIGAGGVVDALTGQTVV
jgi:phage terminase large subunit-like protein